MSKRPTIATPLLIQPCITPPACNTRLPPRCAWAGSGPGRCARRICGLHRLYRGPGQHVSSSRDLHGMSSMESLVVHLRAATASLPAPLLGFGCHAREACFAVPTHLPLDRRRFVCRHYVFLPTTTIIQFARTGALRWTRVWAVCLQSMRRWGLPCLRFQHPARVMSTCPVPPCSPSWPSLCAVDPRGRQWNRLKTAINQPDLV